MELRQLEYFVAVAEERHFTRAAQRVRVAQSGLSASIRSLEKELGAPLFVRSTRRVDLTDAGRALLAEARHALSTVDAAREAVAAVQGLLRGTLAIGTLQCLGGVDLIGLLVAFRTAHPGVEIQLRQGGSPELIDRVRSGDLDVAFVSEPPGGTPGIVFRTLLCQPMILACAADHPLAGRDRVALTELVDETFVDFPPGWVTRDVTDRALADGRRTSGGARGERRDYAAGLGRARDGRGAGPAGLRAQADHGPVPRAGRAGPGVAHGGRGGRRPPPQCRSPRPARPPRARPRTRRLTARRLDRTDPVDTAQTLQHLRDITVVCAVGL